MLRTSQNMSEPKQIQTAICPKISEAEDTVNLSDAGVKSFGKRVFLVHTRILY